MSSKYISERNECLYNAYRRVLACSSEVLSTDAICRVIVNEPCPRFWISTEQALKLISLIKRGCLRVDDMSNLRREMILLIMHRAYLLMRLDAGIPYYVAVERAVYSPAPCFYLKAGSAKTILCNYKKWRRLRLG